MNYNYSTATYFFDNSNLNGTSIREHLINNFNYKQQLLYNENNFLSTLSKTSFEDGQTNSTIEYIKNHLDKNFHVTFNWLCGIFQKCLIDDSNKYSYIRYGILRIISYLISFNYFNCVDNVIIEMIRVGLSSNINYIQEAALMIIDNWDNKKIDFLLKDVSFSNPLLKEYSKKLLCK